MESTNPISIGEKFAFEKLFNQNQFNEFAVISKDDNPIHTDPEFSKKTKFGKTVAHGMFLYANIIQSINSVFEKKPFIQLSQELMFPNPTYTNELIIIELIIKDIIETDIYVIETSIRKPNGSFGLQGKTIIQLLHPNKFNLYKAIPDVTSEEFNSENQFKRIRLHQKDEIVRKLNSVDLQKYLLLMKDNNKLYSDIKSCKLYGLKGLIVPGPMIGALVSFQLGTRLPGKGTNWLKLTLNFKKIVYIEENIKSIVEVIRIRSQKHLINLKVNFFNNLNELVAEGIILVQISDLM